MLLSAHPLAQSNYGDNTCSPGFGNDNSKTITSSTSKTCTHTCCSQCHQTRPLGFQGLYAHVPLPIPSDATPQLPRLVCARYLQSHRTRLFDFSLGNCHSAASPSISALINLHRRIYFYLSPSSVHYPHQCILHPPVMASFSSTSSDFSSSSTSSIISITSPDSETSREATPEFDLVASYEALAPLHWDVEEWDLNVRSEDDESLTDDEDLQILINGDLDEGDDDSWDDDFFFSSEDTKNTSTDDDSVAGGFLHGGSSTSEDDEDASDNAGHSSNDGGNSSSNGGGGDGSSDGDASASPPYKRRVAEPPELFRLKCANHSYTADINSTHFKRNNPLVCRVSARYNHGSTGSKQVYLTRRRVYNHSTAHQF
jgi:hypothetical protein